MLSHPPRRRLGGEEAPAHIDVEREVEVVDRQLEERLRRGEPGVVDECVDPAERLDGRGDEPLGDVEVGEAAPDPVDPSLPEALPQIRERPLVLLIVVLRRVAEVPAVGEQPLGDREADSRVRAGDDRDSVGHDRRGTRPIVAEPCAAYGAML